MNIVLIGNGRMGKSCRAAAINMGHKIIGIFDSKNINKLLYAKQCDAVIDFSNRAALPYVQRYLKRKPAAYVCGSTGLKPSDADVLQDICMLCPAMVESNYSLGFHMLLKAANLARNLTNQRFDIQIAEVHHRAKKDKPGGSALTLADNLNLTEEQIVSVRGGDICGKHIVSFWGTGEYLAFSHTVQSTEVFARGAIAAAECLLQKEPGLYRLNEYLEDLNV